jgi:hypothetical protein
VVNFNRKDDDGHKYLIPKEMLAEFNSLLEKIQNSPFMSEAKWAAEDEFNGRFYEYMVG